MINNFPRLMTKEEKALLLEGISKTFVKDRRRLKKLMAQAEGGLLVYNRCTCGHPGCITISFEPLPHKTSKNIITDSWTKDGRILVIFTDRDDADKIVMMEVI